MDLNSAVLTIVEAMGSCDEQGDTPDPIDPGGELGTLVRRLLGPSCAQAIATWYNHPQSRPVVRWAYGATVRFDRRMQNLHKRLADWPASPFRNADERRNAVGLISVLVIGAAMCGHQPSPKLERQCDAIVLMYLLQDGICDDPSVGVGTKLALCATLTAWLRDGPEAAVAPPSSIPPGVVSLMRQLLVDVGAWENPRVRAALAETLRAQQEDMAVRYLPAKQTIPELTRIQELRGKSTMRIGMALLDRPFTDWVAQVAVFAQQLDDMCDVDEDIHDNRPTPETVEMKDSQSLLLRYQCFRDHFKTHCDNADLEFGARSFGEATMQVARVLLPAVLLTQTFVGRWNNGGSAEEQRARRTRARARAMRDASGGGDMWQSVLGR